ncbi:ACP S-malonyltransferase [Synechococcus sp. Cruz-9H2]|uniref:ACP S-malonyltransferase n=1 Tax=unclassified Synechococcus TaxID=2626047 RepID=UPI0020CE6DB7|nr:MULTISPECIES: ACP S-malonyltransferase [unclassified Synechococcus]MCP9820519.1 ACP S-malonyltransferase [Synechococcus sp. Cruz-9H2]MCP9843312.1 ACP S-malonyltransferase [Synechococcus sp. Edmonson 11F2]MCP9855057.1 ACP S-malonyltransferase [Synechococcus sp. Cruz-9C9]MCP9862472.1 ACP S-malonyltransferase [Synechococcus sp. Cruz-7E5]MCP9871381.1 ACP S-malonyltransferase [Synechococcus sp. Cruz-7B9]
MGIAWVFPGQGSQKAGMASGVLELPGARERFTAASDLLGRDLLAICAGEASEGQGEPSDLGDTRNTQPALFVLESLLVDGLKAQGRQADLVAGHSLGELVALYAAEVFDFGTGLELVRRRSELMAAAGGGAMTAVMGFERSELEALVEASEGAVIANDNSAAQVVISGLPEAVAAVAAQLSCKRAIPLAVSGAFHSPFMADAAAAFAAVLEEVPFADASIPVLSNTDPTPCRDGSELKQRLRRQMVSGVRWREIMDQLAAQGIDTVVEIGPGNVLSGLIKRSLTGVTTAQISSAADLGL